MKNILILKFPYSSLFGGGENHTLTIVEKLKDKGFNFYLASSCKILLEEFKKRNWNYQAVKAPKEPVAKGSILLFLLLAPFFSKKLKKIIQQYIQEKNINTIYCLSLTEKILISKWASKKGLKVVWMEHVSIRRWLTKNPLKFLYKKNSSYAKIITASKMLENEVVRLGINPDIVQTIYFGIKIKQPLFNRESLPDNRFNIGFLGRLEKEKGLDILIKSFKQISSQVPEAKLRIVGVGSAMENLKSLAKELQIEDRIKFLGFNNKLDELYPSFDIFVLPSIVRESFGIVLLDALARQTPIIASNLGGIPEIIKNNQNGILIEPGNAQELASKLVWARANYPRMLEMAKNGQINIQTSFSLENTINQFEEVLTHDQP